MVCETGVVFVYKLARASNGSPLRASGNVSKYVTPIILCAPMISSLASLRSNPANPSLGTSSHSINSIGVPAMGEITPSKRLNTP